MTALYNRPACRWWPHGNRRLCPGGEIGRRSGFKIRRVKPCRFESDPGHHSRILEQGLQQCGPCSFRRLKRDSSAYLLICLSAYLLICLSAYLLICCVAGTWHRLAARVWPAMSAMERCNAHTVKLWLIPNSVKWITLRCRRPREASRRAPALMALPWNAIGRHL